jgi:hypothetical protein
MDAMEATRPVPPQGAALEEEAVRLFRRYQVEIVEGMRLCPWAERTRTERRLRESVLHAAVLDEEAALAAASALAEDPLVEIGIVLFPRLRITCLEFERFVSRVVALDAERRPLGTTPFAMAAFHPDARADVTDAERLIPFLRRTPDPTIQLVRRDALDRVREGFNDGTQFIDISVLTTLDLTRDDTLPLRERIARANLRTVKRLGLEEVERRLSAIFRDRTEAYARLGALELGAG